MGVFDVGIDEAKEAEQRARNKGDVLFADWRDPANDKYTIGAGTTHELLIDPSDPKWKNDLTYNDRKTGVDPRNYWYGRTAGGADAAANNALNTGSSAQITGQYLLNSNQAAAAAANARGPAMGDWSAQNNSLGRSGFYGSQLAGLETQQGPSAAQSQLQTGTNQALASQLALARSGRGFGGSAAAMGQAQSNMAGIQANAANSAAELRANEDAAWRQRQAANYGNAAGIYQGIGQQQAGQIQSGINSVYQNRGQNDQTALNYSQLGAGSYFQGVNANLAGQQGANQIRNAELNAGLTQEDNALRLRSAEQGWALAQQQRQDQQDAATWNAVSSGGATLLTMAADDNNNKSSDIRGKTNIVPDQGQGDDFGRSLSFDGTLYRPIDFNQVGNDRQARNLQGAHAGGGEDMGWAYGAPEQQAVRAAPGSLYEYRNPGAPGAAPGRFYGPMAQDLAKTPAGASAVTQGPDGKLGVDTGRLSLVNTGALSAQQRQIDAQAAELERLRAAYQKFGASPSKAVYAKRSGE